MGEYVENRLLEMRFAGQHWVSIHYSADQMMGTHPSVGLPGQLAHHLSTEVHGHGQVRVVGTKLAMEDSLWPSFDGQMCECHQFS